MFAGLWLLLLWRWLLGRWCAVVDRVDRLPCSGLDPLGHRCGAGCLPIVARGLPHVEGYRWRYGSISSGCWSLWLERIGGGGGRWFVLDRPAAHSARELVAVIHAYVKGSQM